MSYCIITSYVAKQHAELAQLVELYVEALNTPGGVPAVGSTWQRVLETTYTSGLDKALSCYKAFMTKNAHTLPMKNEKLLSHHSDAINESLQCFQEAASLDSESKLYQTYLDKLMVIWHHVHISILVYTYAWYTLYNYIIHYTLYITYIVHGCLYNY